MFTGAIDNNKTEQMVESLGESKDLSELNKNIKKIFESFDVDRFSIMGYFDSEFKSFDTYPQDWIQYYISNQYYAYDPVLSWDKIRLPFSWKGNEMRDLTPTQERLFSEAHDFVVKTGITLSVPSCTGQTFLTLLDYESHHPSALYALSLAAQSYWHFIQTTKAKNLLSLLTAREREIIFLKTKGLAMKGVATTLNISESTVVFHLTNIKKKLKVSNSEQALFLIGLAISQFRGRNHLNLDNENFNINAHPAALRSLLLS